MYEVTDVTSRYSADHITSLGSSHTQRYRMDELYLLNGGDDLNTQATQITIVGGLAGKAAQFKPKLRPAIGSNKGAFFRKTRRNLGSYSPNYMTRSTLSSMKEDVDSLQKQIDSKAKVPDWAESYIYTAGDRINSVDDYMSHRQGLSGASNLGFGFEITDDFPYLAADAELKMATTILAGAFGLYLLWTPITGIIKGGLGVVEKVFDVRAAWKRGSKRTD